MTKYFCVSVTFLDGRFHGRYGDGEPEWPPSPLRLFQAIVAANASDVDSGGHFEASLHWLERQPPPSIITPPAEVGTGYVLSVPNNAMDIVGRAWSKGNYFGSGDSNPATHRTMKRVRPVQMFENDVIHYVWSLSDADAATNSVMDALTHCAKKIFTLGWGVDQVVANADVLDADQTSQLQGKWWNPNVATGNRVLRVPREGTLNVLRKRHGAFLNRITASGFVPVDPLTEFAKVGYRKPGESLGRPHVVFELRNEDDRFFAYPQRKLIHIAGMVRHLAIETMKHSPPLSVDDVDQWVDRYVAGHSRNYEGEHRQLSYLPLPSIGHRHADHTVRRVMISAPPGDDRLLDHLATRLAGMRLKPTKRTPLESPPTLIRVYRDKVAASYTRPANTWASVTPVVLPGHNDRKPAKTVRLMEKALRQSGIDQPCSFEWRTVSWWPKSLTAFKYDRDRKPTGYIRPDHLETLSLVHLKLRFDDHILVPGPIAVGSGRHCGLGITAGLHIQ